MSFIRSFMLVVFCLSMVACAKVPLVQDLAQNDANEILVLLAKHGITAKKVVVHKQQETSWMIEVAKSDEERAQQLLLANHLPRQRELGLSGVCKDTSMIPTPKMEKCRELLAIKGEIINSFESIPGVVNADVVINIPDKQDFPDENTPPQRPTASVVVQMGEIDGIEMLNEEKVQQFVANSVTGMDIRDVAVIISRATPAPVVGDSNEELVAAAPATPDGESGATAAETADLVSVGGLTMSPESANKFKVLTVVFLALFVVLSAALIGILLKLSKVRQIAGLNTGSTVSLPEKVSMNQLVDETRQAEEVQK